VTADAAFRRFIERRYFSSLDGLRCLAIAPVIWHHSTPRPYQGLLGRGHLGVELFFCISGFLITTLLCRERRTTGRVLLGGFYARRVRRIFPLYYAVLLLTTLFAAVLTPGDAQRAHFFQSLPAYATYTTNWFVDFGVAHAVLFAFSWSLATEEQFYLLWPPLVKALRRGGLAALMTALVALDYLAEHAFFAAVLPKGAAMYRIQTSFDPAIAIGCIAALVVDSPSGFRWLWPVLGRPWSAPAALALVIALTATWVAPFWVYCIALTVLVVCCAIRPDHGLCRVADRSWVRHVGVVSYGMYLVHVAVIGALRALEPSVRELPLLVFPVAFALSALLATVSYRHFESRFRRSGQPAAEARSLSAQGAGSTP
jgi:peptidoglycan/LPS O-acetylase OafA/YrhL